MFSEAFAGKARSEAYLDSLTELERVSQIFLVNIEGNVSYSACEFMNGHPVVPGGVILFSFNIGDDREQVKSYISSIRNYCEEKGLSKPYVSIDQEGGLVNRLRHITENLPSNRKIADFHTVSEAEKIYASQAREMAELGIHLNLAPVAEPLLEMNADFLDSRSYGKIPKACAYSVACIDGYEKNGIGTAVKHFPGNTNVDPHTGLPEIGLSRKDVLNDFILPFALVIGRKPSAVIMSHACIPSFDENPACLSSFWIHDVLREKIGYGGLVISDDIFMAALAKNGYPPEIACVKAIESGVDVMMLSEKKFLSIAEKLLLEAKENRLFAEKLREAELRVVEYKYLHGVL